MRRGRGLQNACGAGALSFLYLRRYLRPYQHVSRCTQPHLARTSSRRRLVCQPVDLGTGPEPGGKCGRPRAFYFAGSQHGGRRIVVSLECADRSRQPNCSTEQHAECREVMHMYIHTCLRILNWYSGNLVGLAPPQGFISKFHRSRRSKPSSYIITRDPQSPLGMHATIAQRESISGCMRHFRSVSERVTSVRHGVCSVDLAVWR